MARSAAVSENADMNREMGALLMVSEESDWDAASLKAADWVALLDQRAREDIAGIPDAVSDQADVVIREYLRALAPTDQLRSQLSESAVAELAVLSDLKSAIRSLRHDSAPSIAGWTSQDCLDEVDRYVLEMDRLYLGMVRVAAR